MINGKHGLYQLLWERVYELPEGTAREQTHWLALRRSNRLIKDSDRRRRRLLDLNRRTRWSVVMKKYAKYLSKEDNEDYHRHR